VLRAVEGGPEADHGHRQQQRDGDEVEEDDARRPLRAGGRGHDRTFRTAAGSWSSAPRVITSASPMRRSAGEVTRESATTASTRTPYGCREQARRRSAASVLAPVTSTTTAACGACTDTAPDNATMPPSRGRECS